MATRRSSAATELDPFDAFLDAVNKRTGDGRDIDKARQIAEAYIAANPEEFKDFIGMTALDCANLASVYNAAAEKVPQARKDGVRLEMWVRAKFETQDIGGEVQAVQRDIPGFDE